MMAVTVHPDVAVLDKLKTQIQGLRSKTTDNGCTAIRSAERISESGSYATGDRGR